MRVVLVAVMTAAACGKGGGAKPAPDVEACTNMAKVCGTTYTEADVRRCATDWPKFSAEFGSELTERFVTCTREAKTCAEAQACGRGAVAALRDRAKAAEDKMRGGAPRPEPDGEDLAPDRESGTTGGPAERLPPLTDPGAMHRDWFDKQSRERMAEARAQMEAAREEMKNNPLFHDTAPLPPECERANELCAKDEPFARRHCRDMVADLRGDTANLDELVRCQNEAKSCAAFKKCRDDMWFKIN